MSRALVISLLLILAGILVPFAIWGARFDAALSLGGTREWMAGYGDWAWLAGLLLLASDIILPVPSTVVMSALGLAYGWFIGGLLASAGSFLAGMTAYVACRWLGRPAALWIAGEQSLQRGELLFAKRGGWLVALSRWMPVLPEAVSCMAGLVRMDARTYMLSLLSGSLPVGFVFAFVGSLGTSNPALAIGGSLLLPILLWWAAHHCLRQP